MNTKLIYTISLYLVVLFTSCDIPSQTTYSIPLSRQQENKYFVANVPNLQSQNKPRTVSLDLISKSGEKPTQSAVHFSVMPLKKIGLMLNYTSGGSILNATKTEYGIAYYPILKKNFVWSSFIGYGYGNINNTHATGLSTIYYTITYFQPNLIFRDNSNALELGFTPRISFVNYKKIDTAFDGARELYNKSQYEILYQHRHQVFFEPGLSLNFGFQKVKFKIGTSAAYNLTTNDLNISNKTFYLGLSFNHLFNTQKKKTDIQ